MRAGDVAGKVREGRGKATGEDAVGMREVEGRGERGEAAGMRDAEGRGGTAGKGGSGVGRGIMAFTIPAESGTHCEGSVVTWPVRLSRYVFTSAVV